MQGVQAGVGRALLEAGQALVRGQGLGGGIRAQVQARAVEPALVLADVGREEVRHGGAADLGDAFGAAGQGLGATEGGGPGDEQGHGVGAGDGHDAIGDGHGAARGEGLHAGGEAHAAFLALVVRAADAAIQHEGGGVVHGGLADGVLLALEGQAQVHGPGLVGPVGHDDDVRRG